LNQLRLTKLQVEKLTTSDFIPKSVPIDVRLGGTDRVKKSLTYNTILTECKATIELYQRAQKEHCIAVQELEVKIATKEIQEQMIKALYHIGKLMYLWATKRETIEDEVQVHRFVFETVSDSHQQILAFIFPNTSVYDFCNRYIRTYSQASQALTTYTTRSEAPTPTIIEIDNGNLEEMDNDTALYHRTVLSPPPHTDRTTQPPRVMTAPVQPGYNNPQFTTPIPPMPPPKVKPMPTIVLGSNTDGNRQSPSCYSPVERKEMLTGPKTPATQASTQASQESSQGSTGSYINNLNLTVTTATVVGTSNNH
jgi:hypothetical protein